MQNYPTVVALPFKDGVREVPEHIATLIKQYQILTHELTYEQVLERVNWHNADNAVNTAFNKIRDNHLKQYGI